MMLAAACAFLLFGGSAGDANVGRACAVVAALAVSLRGVCVTLRTARQVPLGGPLSSHCVWFS